MLQRPASGHPGSRDTAVRAMPEENIEIVRRTYAAWTDGAPVYSGYLDSEIERVNPTDAVETGVHTGLGAFDSAAERIGDTFDDVRVEFDRFLMRATGRWCSEPCMPADAGSRRGASGGTCGRSRDGGAIRFEWFNTPGAALRAAGIEGS
jgi:hypothetical protein